MSSVKKRPDGRWRARYRDDAGHEHAKHFARKVDGQRWLDEVTASVVTGAYVDPKAGRLTFREYAETWREAQVHRPSTVAHVETTLRRHAYTAFGDRPLSTIRPGDIQAWTKRLSLTLQPASVGVAHGIVAAVFKAAVRDRRIPSNPCEGTRLPRREPSRLVPLETEAVMAIAAAMPARYRALVILAAGTGLRQGECLGLSVEQVDFLRRTLRVDRQLCLVQGAPPYIGPPKTRASHRDVPMPQVVVDELAAHLSLYPASADGGLIFTDELARPIRRTNLSPIWRRGVRTAGVDRARFHDLRHYYASLLIRHGENVKVVQARLGHATAAETLDTYSHLWPDSEDRTREAVDSILAPGLPIAFVQ